MKPFLVVALAASLVLAACDRPPQPKTDAAAPPPAASGAGPSTPTTPAPQTGAPTASEKREGANPTQGEVDPKDAAQHRDFQQKGDSAGPKSAETAPKSN